MAPRSNAKRRRDENASKAASTLNAVKDQQGLPSKKRRRVGVKRSSSSSTTTTTTKELTLQAPAPAQAQSPASSSSSSSSSSDTFFRWNDLPGELKNRVYAYVLQSDGPIVIGIAHRSDRSGRRMPRVWSPTKTRLFRRRSFPATACHGRVAYFPGTPVAALGLLRASRQTHREACPVLWQRNNLCFTDTPSFALFVQRFDPASPQRATIALYAPAALAWVRHVTFRANTVSRPRSHEPAAAVYGSSAAWAVLARACAARIRSITFDARGSRDLVADARAFAAAGAGDRPPGAFRTLVSERRQQAAAAAAGETEAADGQGEVDRGGGDVDDDEVQLVDRLIRISDNAMLLVRGHLNCDSRELDRDGLRERLAESFRAIIKDELGFPEARRMLG